MKIVIVRPPMLIPVINMSSPVVQPLGVAYVAATLRQEGHEVGIVDAIGSAIEKYTPAEPGTLLHGLTIEETAERIPAGTECIGISIQFSYEWPIGRKLLNAVRSRFPKALLIAGGEHMTAAPEFSLQESPLDAAVLGEGEHTTAELVRAFEKERFKGLESVPGICFKTPGGEIKRTPPGQRMRDLETIPWPAWDLIPMEEYLKRGCSFGVSRGRTIPILASRGCPYQCTFCSNPQMWTTRWIARDPMDVLNEIDHLQKTYQATNFDFYDLTMIVKKQWILDFCSAIKSRGMLFTWQLPSGTRSEAIDDEVSTLLYETGCRNLSYAPESGSPETLIKIKKKIHMPKFLQSMRSAITHGLNVKANLIFGFPHESWRHLMESMWFIVRAAIVGIHDISIWVFVPYPGSELFDQLRAEEKIKKMDDAYFYRLAAYADITQNYSYCDRLSKQDLLFARIIGLSLFYGSSWLLRPWRPLRMLYNSLSGNLESRSELVFQNILKRAYRWAAHSSHP